LPAWQVDGPHLTRSGEASDQQHQMNLEVSFVRLTQAATLIGIEMANSSKGPP